MVKDEEKAGKGNEKRGEKKIQKRRKSEGGTRGRQAYACGRRGTPTDFVQQRFFGQQGCRKKRRAAAGTKARRHCLAVRETRLLSSLVAIG